MTKISALTAVVTAAATDTLAVVQGGVTKKATMQDYIDDGITEAAGAAAAVLATSLQKASNLSDVTNAATARTNIGAETAGAAATVQGNLTSHTGNTSNPHSVTAAQIGAAALANAVSATATGDYRLIACVLRNTAGVWAAIDDSQHTPIGVASVTQTGSLISVNFTNAATKVVSSAITPDEAYAGLFAFGASVGVSAISIYCYSVPTVAHKSWLCSLAVNDPYFSVDPLYGQAGAPSAVSWSGGELTITASLAEAATFQGVPTFDPMGWDVDIRTARNTINESNMYLNFYDRATGVRITDPVNFPAGFRFVVERTNNNNGYVSQNPAAAVLQVANSNLWVMALVKMT